MDRMELERERPSAGEAYVNPVVCLGNNDRTSPGPNKIQDSPSMPVQPVRNGFELYEAKG